MVEDKEKDSKTNELIIEDSNDEFEGVGHYNAEDYLDLPPDGGFTAWLCCACISVMNMIIWGATSAFSIFLAFYLDHDMFPGATPTDYALIGGLVLFFTLFLIPFSNVMLIKFGYRITVFIGIVIQVASYIGASFATTLVQLYWTQGILMGISSGIIFSANLIVLPSWFLKKRALANSFTHFGLGIGGAVISLVVNALIQRTGNQKWALRVLGIMSFVVLTTTMFLVKVRETKKADEMRDKTIIELLKDSLNYKVWFSFPLQLASLWASICNIGYVTCLFSFSNYARSLGLSADQATNVTVAMSIAQAFGRPMIGIFSSMFGTVNFSIFATFYTCVFIFCFWMNATTYASLICLAIFLGFFIGISSVNMIPLTVDVSGVANFPSALTFVNTSMAITSVVAELIALNLRNYSLQGTPHRTPYFYCQIFVGCIYFVSIFVLVPYRAWKVDRMCSQLSEAKRTPPEQKVKYKKLNEDRSIKAFFQKACYPVRI